MFLKKKGKIVQQIYLFRNYSSIKLMKNSIKTKHVAKIKLVFVWNCLPPH